MKKIRDVYKKNNKFFKFGLIGIIGTLINTGLLWLLTVYGGLFYLVSSAIATETAIISNFFGNHFFTFKDNKDPTPAKKKFLKFQLISLTTIIGTIFLLWLFIDVFNMKYLILSNLLAIGIMFIANFFLNRKFTWRKNPLDTNKLIVLFLFVFSLITLSSSTVTADLAAVSQMEYHPDSYKQIILYTSDQTANFLILDKNGDTVYSSIFEKPKNYYGDEVNCQGNNPCLVGDFTNLTKEGTYTISIDGPSQYNPLPMQISNNTFKDNAKVFLEFFDAQKQQGSSYHKDFHSDYSPDFSLIADGSFIMESHQAAVTLIRLGSAYNRNPNFLDKNKIQKIILDHVNYLEGLQGLEIQEMGPSNPDYEKGFRLIPDVKVHNVFVPGETNLTSIDLYGPGENPSITDSNVPVTSLCENSSDYQSCLNFAQEFYKCQVDEPCINATYIENTGKVTGKEGYGVAIGWGTEFGCYIDVDLSNEMFQGEMNPCLIFKPEETRENTAITLLAFTSSIPALSEYDQIHSTNKAQELLLNSINTKNHIDENFDNFDSGDDDAGFYAAALLHLFDFTNDSKYLIEAYNLRDEVTPDVSNVFNSDKTRGSEFYWKEYANHKNQIEDLGFEYEYLGKTPQELFLGKMYHDYKDRGDYSISNNGERVFQYDHNIQFQNSRYMLTEAVLATKTKHLNPEITEANFLSEIADNQLAWLTGMNAVQQGVGLNAPVASYSFIFGIAPEINPKEFHSRYLINSGYSEKSNGKVIGVRGSAKQFFNGTDYIYLDGRHEILGKEMGSSGNGYNGESKTELWDLDQNFENGKSYIPGWINGVFDTNKGGEDDTIFNYDDTVNTYEFTETTNEMVATAIELFAYLDANHNNISSIDIPLINFNESNNESNEPPTQNQTIESNATIVLDSIPDEATIYINGSVYGVTPKDISIEPGTYNLTLAKENYYSNSTILDLIEGEEVIIIFILVENNETEENVTLFLESYPPEAQIIINGSLFGTTPKDISIEPGTYNLTLAKENYSTNSTIINLFEDTELFLILLPAGNETDDNQTEPPINQTFELTIDSNVSQVNIFINGSPSGVTPANFTLAEGTYNVTLTKENYTQNSTIVNLNQNLSIELSLNPIEDNETEPPINNDTNITVSINSSVLDANILIDGILRGELTPANLSLGPGIYNFTLTKENYSTNSTIQNISLNPEVYLSIFPLNETNSTNENQTNQTQPPANNDPPSTSGGSTRDTVDLVYVVLGSDVLAVNATQTIALDARGSIGVRVATAIFTSPTGNFLNVSLELTQGSRSYGTWQGEIIPNTSGLYRLTYVDLQGSTIRSYERFEIEDRSFYATSDEVLSHEELQLIYTAIEKSEVEEIQNVSVTLDARDFEGVENVTGLIEKTRGTNSLEKFTLNFSLIGGDKKYGTWQSFILVDEGDVTYNLREITLKKEGNETTHNVTGRSLYATSDLPVKFYEVEREKGFFSFITGFTILGEGSDNPSFPFILGLIIFISVVIFYFIAKKWNKFSNRNKIEEF